MLGLGIVFIPIYFYKENLIYNLLLCYDTFVNYQSNQITYTGINNEHTINTSNYQDIKNYDIQLINFTINNNIKTIHYKNNIDITKLKNETYYNSDIILATIDLYSNTNDSIVKDIDITDELNKFMRYNTEINLTNSKTDKLLWISLINNKFNYDYFKDLTINYKLMDQHTNNYNSQQLNINVTNGILKILNKIST